MEMKGNEIINNLEGIIKVFSNTIPCKVKTKVNYDENEIDFDIEYLVYCSFCKKSIVTNIHIYEYNDKYMFRLFAFITDGADYNFDLWDYLVYKNITFDEEIFNCHIPQNEWYNTVYCYSNLIAYIIKDNDMQRILNTDYAPEIPIDWSRCGYK